MKQLLTRYTLFSLPLIFGAYLLAFQGGDNPEVPEEKSINVSNSFVVEEEIPWVNEQLKSLSLREKIGQFFMVAAYSKKDESHFREIDSLVIRDRVGGIIFFQGNQENLKMCIDRFQGKAEVPLLVGMDAEWGVSMRLSDAERFPYNYTIGAANDPELAEKIGALMGQECRELGIHLNFAPVADVNSNPNNPVIGFRSFGENPKHVADLVAATVKGMEGQGVMTSIKHFPGHGDTDVDSHLELPMVNNPLSHIDAIDLFPFRAGIRAGASTVMIAHLNVPALDDTGTPSSLSPKIIKGLLQNDMGFKGLVVSDALGMKAVANRYGKTEVVVKAFMAGCDILLFPESVGGAIDAIEKRVVAGEISTEEIDRRVEKVLRAKYKHIIQPKSFKKFNAFERELAIKQLYEKSITVVRNENNLFPIRDFDQKILHVSIGESADELIRTMDQITVVEHQSFKSGQEAITKLNSKLNNYDLIITSFHPSSVLSKNDYGMPKDWRNWVKILPANKKNVLVQMGNPYVLGKNVNLDHLTSIVVGYENHTFAQNRMAQFLVGAIPTSGKLPVRVSESLKREQGIDVEWGGKLKDSQPEELGVSREKLDEIDAVVQKAIDAKALPGCQVLVAVDGKIIFDRSYGKHTYEGSELVQPTDLYDIASVTKIASSTLSLMHLQTLGEFNLSGTIGEYLPDLVNNTPYANMKFKDMLAHQAGLTPWIPFYTKTVKGYRPDPSIYSTDRTETNTLQVGKNMWISPEYANKMYQEILSTPLKPKRYKYSDVGYYFFKKIIELKSGESLDKYVVDEFYHPMGLNRILYNPQTHYKLSQIVPTERDTIFRKQLVHGFVHDQGTAMLGGVGGHAGLFANSRDLATIVQLFLNKGKMGGIDYISPDIVDEFTGCQYCPTNRRGAGFDKPSPDGSGGPVTKMASLSSYGHSGFTGTLVWADPKYKLNYVFLSNRVYPDAENWKIVKMNVRSEIHEIIYQAVKAAN